MQHHQQHHPYSQQQQHPAYSSPLYHNQSPGSQPSASASASPHHPPPPLVPAGAYHPPGSHMMQSMPPPHQSHPHSHHRFMPANGGQDHYYASPPQVPPPPLASAQQQQHYHHHHQQQQQQQSFSPPGGSPSSSNSPPSHDSAPSPLKPKAALSSASPAAAPKSVVRAACLACRTAKRRCDGQQPICGPCTARGATEETGQCQYVASKRGGPRFKGRTGEEAKQIKAEKERQKQLEAATGRKMSVSPEVSPSRGIGGNGGRQWSHQSGTPARGGPTAAYSLGGSSDTVPARSYGVGGGHGAASTSSSATRSEMSATFDDMNINGRQYPGVMSSTNSAASYSYTSPDPSTGESDAASSSKTRSRPPAANHHYQQHQHQPFAHSGLSEMAPPHYSHHYQQPQHQHPQHSQHPQPAAPAQHHHHQHHPAGPPSSQAPNNFFFPAGQGHSQYAGAAPMATEQPDAHMQTSTQPQPSNALSSANLEMWQKLQESAAAQGLNADLSHISDFYSKLETLPKAGTAAMGQHDDHPDPSAVGGGGGGDGQDDVDMFCHGLTFDPDLEPQLLDAADSEQQARFLLTAFFDKVYPSAPVLVSPENLSSLAFWFSGKGPCALYAAISALVTLRLPEEEAHRTLRGGYQRSPQDGAKAGLTTRAEIAAHHARTSDFLLRRFSQQQAAAAAASFGLDPQALSTGCDPDETGRALCQGPSDPELLRIEAAAAHTLLAHYWYGVGGKGSHKAAYDHALEAWNSLQGIRIELQEGVPPKDPLTTSHFSWEQKQEWAKRVYWTSFAAAACTAVTGGYEPIQYSLDAVAALQLRPALESDVGAWGVFIRGAQHVARGYTTLWDFDRLNSAQRQRDEGGSNGVSFTDEEARREKMRIFHDFTKLDRDMTAFCTYDPAWRQSAPGQPSTSGGGGSVEEDARNNPLGFALRTAGKLMTAGATIVIHRGQAYANANIFMSSQCGLMRAGQQSGGAGCGPVVKGEDGVEQMQGLEEANAGSSVKGRGACSVMPPNDPGANSEMMDEPGSPSDLYVPPDRLWHRSGSTSLPPAGSGSGSISSGAPHHGTGSTEPSVAALDATFIGWGAQPHMAPTPPAASTPTGGVGGAGGSSGFYDGSATSTAMAAFQQFQAQQHHRHHHQKKSSSMSSGAGVPGGPHDDSPMRRTSTPASAAAIAGGGGASHHQHNSSSNTTAPTWSGPQPSDPHHPSNKDRYAHGPFEPSVSASKCRWAANSMLECVAALLPPGAAANAGASSAGATTMLNGSHAGSTVDIMGTLFSEAPALPPWAACTYVLGGYCLLMQCLITQASQTWRSAAAAGSGAAAGPASSPKAGGHAGKDMAVAQEELQGLRLHVVAIHQLLERFALTFEIVHEYKRELGVLLEINRRIT